MSSRSSSSSAGSPGPSAAESESRGVPPFPSSSTPKHPSLNFAHAMDSRSQPLSFPVSDINPPLWPRRASKACASCRRDKIRCDGERPCAGCKKKGIPDDQCIDGCDACRRARVRCEGGKPCQRCRDMHLDCADEAAPGAARAPGPAGPARGPRPAGSDRAKLACANCRRDNKKCDDQRPCSRCVARGEECVHVGRGPKLVKLRCEGCRVDNKRCEDSRPCRQCVELGRECVNLPRRGRGHGTRVKAACTNCRRDKIRCDGVRPCSSCMRKGLECEDRACKTCIKNGVAGYCVHRPQPDTPGSDGDDDIMPVAESSSAAAYPPHQLPPHPAYAPGPSNYYYPVPVAGPGPSSMGGHPPMAAPQYAHDQRTPYYPVIDPNIDNQSPPGPNAPQRPPDS